LIVNTTKAGAVGAAYERCKEARHYLAEMGARGMEETTDKCGIVWIRYILPGSGESVILFGTPYFWDVFAPVCKSASVEKTLAALSERAKGEPGGSGVV
jgi:hypothetical protein